jgi:DNA polymerase III subunit delta
MKIAGARVEALLRRPDPGLAAVLLYGPDEGLVRERARRLVRAVLPEPQDPFGLTELGADAVRAEPALLADEARALSLTGGRRVVRVRQASDQLSEACRALLDLPALAALVVVDAGDLRPSSSLRRLFEAAPKAAAIGCYRDEGQALAGTVHQQLEALGLRADPEAEAFLTLHLGADRGITMSELAKLDLYVGPAADARSPRRVSLEDVAAVVGDSAALGVDDLVDAVALGQAADALRTLERLLAQGLSPVGVVRALASHFGRLYQVACLVDAGELAERAIEKLRPPLHMRRRGSFQAALRRWSLAALAAQAGRLLQAEIGCKTTAWPAAELCREAALAACLAPRR